MHTKILIRPLNFHLRYQHWEIRQKINDLKLFHNSYINHIFGHFSNDIIYEVNPLFTKIYWKPNFKESERIAYTIEHFKNTLLKNKYALIKCEERNEIWDKGIKVLVLAYYLKADFARIELGGILDGLCGDIELEQIIEEGKVSLSINLIHLNTIPTYGFEKLMELLLKP